MDVIPTKQVPCLYSFPFGTMVHDKNSSRIAWAPITRRTDNRGVCGSDNNICIVSFDQFYVLDPRNDDLGTQRSCLYFNKTLVQVPNDSKTSTDGSLSNRKRQLDESFDKYCQQLKQKLVSKQDNFLAKMDPLISKLTHAYKESFMGIRSVKWSPCGRFLAVLKLDGELLLYKHSKSIWVLLKKITEELQEVVRKSIKKTTPSGVIETYDQLKDHLYKCAINCICWSFSTSSSSATVTTSSKISERGGKRKKTIEEEEGSFMLLIAGSKNGFIYLFEIAEEKLDSSDRGESLTGEGSDASGDVRINSFKQVRLQDLEQINRVEVIGKEERRFLLLTSLSGQLFLASIMDLTSSSSDGNISEARIEKEPSLGIDVESRREASRREQLSSERTQKEGSDKGMIFLSIWPEKDDLTIDHFLIINDDYYHSGKKNGKEEYRFTLVATKSTYILFVKLALSFDQQGKVSISKRDTLIGYTSMGMPATGLIRTNDVNRIIVSSGDGQILEVDVPGDEQFKKRSATVSLQQRELNIDTMYKSHAVVFGLETSPHGIMSCLLQRHVVHRNLKQCKAPNNFLIFPNVTVEQVLEQLDQFSSQNVSESMSEIIEYIFCFKGFLDQLVNPSKESCQKEILSLSPFEDFMSKNLGLKSIKTLRHRAIALIQYFKRSTRIAADIESVKELDKVVKEIEVEIFKRQGRDILKRVPKTELQRESFAYHNEIFNKPNSNSKMMCPICQQPFKAVDQLAHEALRSVTCSKGHITSRCTVSLVPIDFTKDQVLTCSLCSSLILTSSVWPDISHCAYCN